MIRLRYLDQIRAGDWPWNNKRTPISTPPLQIPSLILLPSAGFAGCPSPVPPLLLYRSIYWTECCLFCSAFVALPLFFFPAFCLEFCGKRPHGPQRDLPWGFYGQAVINTWFALPQEPLSVKSTPLIPWRSRSIPGKAKAALPSLPAFCWTGPPAPDFNCTQTMMPRPFSPAIPFRLY